MAWVLEYKSDHYFAVPSWASVSVVVRQYPPGNFWHWIVSEYADGEYIDGKSSDGFATPEEAMKAAEAYVTEHQTELEDRWD